MRTYEGIQLMSISRPDLIGQDVSLMTDTNGINSHQLLMETIKAPGGGFGDFDWFNPTTRKVEPQRVSCS